MTIFDALKVLKTSMENTVTAAVKVLKAHTFKVALEKGVRVNFPKVQEVSGHVQVDNFPPSPKPVVIPKAFKISDPVEVSQKSLSSILEALAKLQEAVKKLPTKYPEVKIPPFPKVEIPPFPKIPQPPSEISVTNLERLLSKDPKKYVPVRLTDGKEFYRAIEELAIAAGRSYAYSDARGTKQQALVDQDRHVQADILSMPEISVSATATSDDPTLKYLVSDTDAADTVKYYGFLDKDGNWYIMQEDTTVGTYRYTKGSADYATNWTNRASLTYELFSEVF